MEEFIRLAIFVFIMLFFGLAKLLEKQMTKRQRKCRTEAGKHPQQAEYKASQTEIMKFLEHVGAVPEEEAFREEPVEEHTIATLESHDVLSGTSVEVEPAVSKPEPAPPPPVSKPAKKEPPPVSTDTPLQKLAAYEQAPAPPPPARPYALRKPAVSKRRESLRKMLGSSDLLKQGFIIHEVLGPPKALRKQKSFRPPLQKT